VAFAISLILKFNPPASGSTPETGFPEM